MKTLAQMDNITDYFLCFGIVVLNIINATAGCSSFFQNYN